MEPNARKLGTVSQVLAVAIVMAMVIPASLALIQAYEPTPTADVVQYVRVDIKNAQEISYLETKMDIVESYDSYVVAKATDAEKNSVLSSGFVVESLPEMTTFKFGQYSFDVTNALSSTMFPSELTTYSYPIEKNFYFVKFDAPVKAEWKTAIEMSGMEIEQTVDGYTVMVQTDPANVPALQAMDHVMWVGEFYPAYKISSEVASASGEMTMDVYTAPDYYGYVKKRVGTLFQTTGLGKFFDDYTIPETRVAGRNGFLRLVVDASLATEIARIPNVYYLIRYDQPYIMNGLQHGQVQTGLSTSIGAPASLVPGAYGAAVAIWNQGIFGQWNQQTGKPIVVGSSDTGIRIDHYQFANTGTSWTNANWDTSNGYLNLDYNFSSTAHRKIVRYAIHEGTGWDKLADSASDHGTHTACTAVGYDNPKGGTSVNDGVAPGAKISFYDVGIQNDDTAVYPPPEYSTTWDLAKADGARSYTQSWGSPYQTSYTADMQEIDQYAFDFPTFLFTWSGGNEGTGANTVGQQAESKNAIAVGAYIDGANSMSQATFNSNGPTYDGRLKPDVMAPGTATSSAQSSGTTGYVDMQGTSMASPNAQGGLALMAQYFLNGYYPTGANTSANSFDPSHALIKACLINGCEQMTTSVRAYNNGNGAGNMNYPNTACGWGRIDLDNSLMFTADTLKMQVYDGDNGVETGQYVEYKYRLADATQPFKVTIAWNDYPGAIGSGAALVNDLDLLVTGPTGNVFKGNIFTGTIGSCYTPANSAFAQDHRNNVEEVWVRTADTAAGVWTIRVTGYNVPVPVQPFAIVMTGSLDLTYGTVQVDRDLYGVTQTCNIRIEDNGAGVGPLSVTASSIVAGMSETISCTLLGTGVYTGTVTFTLNANDPAGNGVLPVSAADTLSVRYNDVSGTVHSSWANATIDGYGPTITNVHTGIVSMSSAEILWTTSEAANATVYFGTSPASLTNSVKVNSPYPTSQYVLITGLAINTLYYYDVESTDIHGNSVRATNGGNHFTLTTQSRGDMLVFINGGTGYDYQLMMDKYEWALSDNGWSYNTWASWIDGNPSLATLQLYKVWLFQPGLEQYPQFSLTQRNLVKTYLNAGGRFFTTSQDTMWALGSAGTGYSGTESIRWTQSQLHMTWTADPATFTNIDGVASDPISGAYTGMVAYNAFRSGGYGDQGTTYAGGHTVSSVWTAFGGDATNGICGVKSISLANNGTSGVGVWGGTPSRVVNFAFEWSCIIDNYTVSSTVRADILDLVIQFLIGHDHPDVAVTAPNGGESISTATTTVTWTRSVAAGYSVASQALYYSPNAGGAWYLVTAAIATTATSYVWTVSALPRGTQYLARIVVTDNGPPALIGSDDSNAVFSILTPDTVGPIVQPGSVRVTPNPVTTGQTCWINATIDDSTMGNSNIAQAEYFMDTTGTSGTGTAMVAVDGTYNSPTEAAIRTGTLSLSNGVHTVYVHGRDSAGNWGTYESTTFTFVVGGSPSYPFQNITVAAGWNLISVNITGTTTLPGALTDLTGGVVWSRVMWYNPATPADPWKQYNTAWDASLNDLTTVTTSMGVWVFVTTVGDTQICVGGAAYTKPVSTDITLAIGWNLVGFPSDDTTYTVAMLKAAVTSVTIVEQYDGAQTYLTATMLDAATFAADKGYWVYTTAPGTWTKTY